jgi:hypothetical protein
MTLTTNPLLASSTRPFTNRYTPVSAPIQTVPLASSLKSEAPAGGKP